MIPFQIHMKLKSPLIMYRYPPSLASIVWNCLFFHLRDEVKAKAQLFSIFKSTEEVLHASNLFFVVSPHQTLIAKSHTKVGAMLYEKDLNQVYCKPNGRKDTYTKLLVSGGPYKNRFRLLNNFEEIVAQNNTIIEKFYLHTSYEEQEIRLKERMTNPEKHWKHNDGDWEMRKHWDKFRVYYQDVIDNCSAPFEWNIIPADENRHKEVQVLKKLVSTLEKLDLKYPELDSEM